MIVPVLILVTLKLGFLVRDILTWGRFDCNPHAVNQVRPWRLDCKHTEMFSNGRMSDRNAKNDEDRMHVLSDDLSRFELLNAEETEAVKQEVDSESRTFHPSHFLP